ncbi:MAG: AI-2E family transporter [Geminicoccaceae bacterium]
MKALVGLSWVLIVVVVGTVLAMGSRVLIPMALAVLIWQLINAVSEQIRRVRFAGQSAPRWLRQLLAVAVIVAALALMAWLVITNAAGVTAAAVGYQANLERMLPALLAPFGLPAELSLGQLIGEINLRGLIGSVTSALGTLVGNTGVILLYLIFLMLEQETFAQKVDALLPDPERNARARRLLADIEKRVETYLGIKTLVSAVTAFLSFLVLRIVGVDYAEFWGLLVFLLNFIPIFGSIFGVVLPVLLTLVQFAEPAPVIAVAVGLGAIQFTLGNIVEPRLMGMSLNLSPLVIMVSLAVWGSLWGVVGMLLCVPITVIAMIICAHFEPTRPVAVLLSANGRVD